MGDWPAPAVSGPAHRESFNRRGMVCGGRAEAMSKGFEKKKASGDEFKNMPDKLLLEPYKGGVAANARHNGYKIYEVALAALKTPLGKKVHDFLADLHANPAQFDESSDWGYCKGEHGNDHRNLPAFPPAGGQYI